MFSTRRLYELQQVDSRADQVRRELARVEERLADSSEVQAARRRVAELEGRLDQASAQRRSLEMTAQEERERLEALRARMYGGSITNPRELEAYQEEEGYLSRRLGETEDRLLEAMVEAEETGEALAEARRDLERLEAERRTETAALREERDRLQGELERLEAERSALAQGLPAQALGVYDSLRRSRGGLAVVLVERGTCQGCRVSLPTMDVQRARRGQELVQCNSCRRILYVA